MTTGRALAAAILAGVLLMAPALVFDARVLAHPSTFHYPSGDYFQYVTGQPAGSRWPDVADTIRRRATSGRVVILTPQAESYILTLLLLDDPRFQVVVGSPPLAASAQFAVYETGNPLLDVAADQVVTRNHFVSVRRYQRPDGGAVITMRQRAGK